MVEDEERQKECTERLLPILIEQARGFPSFRENAIRCNVAMVGISNSGLKRGAAVTHHVLHGDGLAESEVVDSVHKWLCVLDDVELGRVHDLLRVLLESLHKTVLICTHSSLLRAQRHAGKFVQGSGEPVFVG